jgi:dihydropyrimidine dehydrogenase (NAD+) subunit PreA
MADMHVEKFGMINPFVIASSPATQGARNLLKSSASRPGALVLRNFGHGSGGGSFIYPDANAMYRGNAFHSHAVGTQVPDDISTLEQYAQEVRDIKKELDSDIKLWVSVGHYSDIVKGGDWEKNWCSQAKELALAGADALELHFNTPGVAVAKDRTFDYYHLVSYACRLIHQAVPDMPIMVKLAIEDCDALTTMRGLTDAGAFAVGPTARWKGFYFDLDWKSTQARPGSGYGGTQATPIVCYNVAEARSKGITFPMYAGGGVFSAKQALQILMAGSECVQVGALACSGGVGAVRRLIADTEKWMDENGYKDMRSLTGAALSLFSMDKKTADLRAKRLGDAYKGTPVDAGKCIGCGRCVDVCWHDAIHLEGKKAVKGEKCIGCGYCYGVCPTGALHVDAPSILKAAYDEAQR